MALDGMAAVQARIQEINQTIAALSPQSAAAVPAKSANSADFAALLAGATDAGTTGTGVGIDATNGPSSATAQQFLATALSEKGKPYVWGASASISDPNPRAFDCSELTKWAAGRVGVTIPDGATEQYRYLREQGTTMTVDQALHTPGALLFHFDHNPSPGRGGGEDPHAHVAISLGDGVHTIEARGRNYGTNVFDNAAGRDFNYAGMIPGM
jgi:cell wall-associated NlpC family hydrolase